MLKLRQDAESDSIFLAAENLPAGEPVSPEVVEKALRESDLAIFVCGRETRKSPWVAREVELALALGIEILPILLRAGVIPPAGLDFRIQGIHLSHLFPAIRYARIALATILAVALGTAAWFGWSTYRGRADLARSEVEAWMDLDGTRTPSVVDVGRHRQLLQHEQRASRWGYEELRRRLESDRARMLDPGLRRVVMPENRSRRAIETDPFAGVVWVGEKIRVEARRTKGELVVEIDLRALVLRNPEIFSPSDLSGPFVSPASLHGLAFEPIAGGVTLEVEYDGPARRSEDAQLSRDESGRLVLEGGGWIEADERELLLVSPDGRLTSLGLTRHLVERSSSNPLGEQTGASESWFELAPEEPRPLGPPARVRGSRFEATLRELLFCMYEIDYLVFPELNDPDSEGEEVVPDFRHTRAFPLARDPDAGRELLEVEHAVDPYGQIQDLNTELRITFAALIGGDRPIRITTAEQYHPRAKYIYFEDAGESYEDDYEDPSEPDREEHPGCVLPEVEGSDGLGAARATYTPAALKISSRRALLGARLIDLDTGSERLVEPLTNREREVAGAWFTISGDLLITTWADGSISAFRSSDGALLHRFIRPFWVLDATVTADGEELWLLLENGEIEAWPLRAFGPDGWAVGASTG